MIQFKFLVQLNLIARYNLVYTEFIYITMLYLEDYLEMIEHLPQEMRDRFTEMREMDLQVQNNLDSLEDRVKSFFGSAPQMKETERDAEYEKIDQDYHKTLEDADEKVHMANQICELVARYIRKLDQELQKFKMELEADNAGITQILEQRSLEIDKQIMFLNAMQNSNRGEKRKHSAQNSGTLTPEKQTVTERVISTISNEVMRETMSTNRMALMGHSPSSSSTSSSCSTNSIPERNPVLAQPKSHPFGGGNALAAAASQAIAATQQSLKRTSNQSQSSLMQQGRRTASLKASYEAINSGVQSFKEFTIGSREIACMPSVVSNVSSNISASTEPKTKATKKSSRTSTIVHQPEPTAVLEDSEDSSAVDDGNYPIDWTYDPNEPRYCVCNQVSYGDMVACDNEDCPFEWFHYPCVGITQPPKGKWFCPQCMASMKRRNRK